MNKTIKQAQIVLKNNKVIKNKKKSQQDIINDEIDVIVEKVCDKLERRLYLNVGRGVMSVVWKLLLIILIGLAAYGSFYNPFKN